MAEKCVGAGIRQFDGARLIGDHHCVRSGFEHSAKSLFSPGELVCLGAQELLRPPEFDKYVDLALKDFGNDGLEEKVDRAEVISTKELFVAAVGGYKQNGRLQRPAASPDHFRRLKS